MPSLHCKQYYRMQNWINLRGFITIILFTFPKWLCRDDDVQENPSDTHTYRIFVRERTHIQQQQQRINWDNPSLWPISFDLARERRERCVQRVSAPAFSAAKKERKVLTMRDRGHLNSIYRPQNKSTVAARSFFHNEDSHIMYQYRWIYYNGKI